MRDQETITPLAALEVIRDWKLLRKIHRIMELNQELRENDRTQDTLNKRENKEAKFEQIYLNL